MLDLVTGLAKSTGIGILSVLPFMAIEVKRKEGESPNALLFRFSKKVKQSGLMKEGKRRRFYARPASKRARRLSAQHREQKKKNIERLKRLGLL